MPKFRGECLTGERRKAVLDFLEDRFDEIKKDIDEFTDMSGRIILAERSELDEKLRKVV